MSRTQSRDNSSSVSLFPFLAVLLCTMGGLVVLLVAMSHVSRQLAKQEKQRAEAQAAAAPVVDNDNAEQLASLQEQATALREKAEEVRAAQRADQLRIAQIEEHVRKLQDEMQLIQATELELAADDSQRYDDRAQAERELARLQQLIEDSELDIAQMREATQGQTRSYAVVPYQGASGTRRQPIYIECLADRVVLQPEGIELTENDFASPLGVGNPLAAALRATRDHMVRNNSAQGGAPENIEPYPLILVRPDGIGAYYQVRSAIRSWDTDFGYEMIEGDWTLEFAPPDPQLANVAQRAIDNARIRREALASAAPTAFSAGSGSFAIPEVDGELIGDNPYDPTVLGAGTVGGGGGRSGSQGASEASGYSGAAGHAGGTGGAGGPDGGYAVGEYASTPYPAGGTGGAGGAATGDQIGPYEGTISGPPGGYSAIPSAADGQPGAPNAAAFGQPGQTVSSGAGQPAGATGATATAGGSAAGSPGGGQSTSMGPGASMAADGGSGGKSGGAASLNERSGPDDVAIRRTVRVAVFADRLQVGKEPTPLAMPGPTSAHIDNFVASVKQQIESWGLAGHGLYWRPVIKLDVRQGGERRAAEIEAVLKRSGVDVEPIQTATLPNREPSSVAW
ncbi:hypothetical protein Pla123a_45040 [Posidoniimonas polymericola]|uniref:IncA protein n=1 Tax=Posidoniimonas polymericola TaxID=2528002 RepID=A0A5C5XU22_9BACT|nr:hypothetical protein [Posidoniimonas polymericola]TWT66806.1 hypothetical protein Pla123a_45040 [Posidoniimonas polymericola]